MQWNNEESGFTDDGGFYRVAVNKTGSASEKGTVVQFCTGAGDLAFDVAPLSSYGVCGIVYDDGIADGDPCRVVVAGCAKVLLESTTGSTAGHWVRSSDTEAGRANATTPVVPESIPLRFQQLGQAMETKGSGELCSITLHMN
jgi:hypothetical protein